MAYVDGFVVPVPRDEINAQVMQDPRLKEIMEPNNMPFDGKRLVFGGFELAVEL